MVCFPRRLLVLPILLALASLTVPVSAGEIWWREYGAQIDDALLLHFGPPAPSLGKLVAQTVQQQQAADPLAAADALSELDLEEDDGLGGLELPDKITREEVAASRRPAPIDDRNVPPGVVLDYSDARRRAQLAPDGPRLTPDGKFGGGLQCVGRGGLAFDIREYPGERVRAGTAVEFWVRVEDYPMAPACMASYRSEGGGAGVRLLLHPDGRVELLADHPLGNPTLPERIAVLKELLAKRNTRVLSPDPLPKGQWVHVAAMNGEVIVQGYGSPSSFELHLNGRKVAEYITEPNNGYSLLSGPGKLVVGNSQDGTQPFTGTLDEVRITCRRPSYYPAPELPWRTEGMARSVQFGPPAFRADRLLRYASLDGEAKYDIDRSGAGAIELPAKGQAPASLRVEGVRGAGWRMDPTGAFPRFDLRGLDPRQGALEFWACAPNWDRSLLQLADYTLPEDEAKKAWAALNLSGVRLWGRDKRDGAVKIFAELDLKAVPLTPGQWTHLVLQWLPPLEPPKERPRGYKPPQTEFVYLDGATRGAGRFRRLDAAELAHIEPLYAEFGIPPTVQTVTGEVPLLAIDEVAFYSAPFPPDEIARARDRWVGELKPMASMKTSTSVGYKYSIGELTFRVRTEDLPEAKRVSLTLHRVDGPPQQLAGPLAQDLDPQGQAELRVLDRSPLPHGRYEFRYALQDAGGQTLVEETSAWSFEKEPWRNNRLGILTKTPPPWTPVQVEGRTVSTRMTRYVLGDGGLPVELHADGVNLLAGPVRLLEDGTPMRGEGLRISDSNDVDATWTGRFRGTTCDVTLQCTIEYDGMVRHELRVEPKSPDRPVARLTLDVPLRSEHATRYAYCMAGAVGMTADVLDTAQGTLFQSRRPSHAAAVQQAKRKKEAPPAWETYEAWAFCNQLDVSDRNRGIYWFADNAAGWAQSKSADAQEIVREGDAVHLRLHLVAAPAAYESDRPIVFGVLPHPARPLPEWHRKLQRCRPEDDKRLCNVYGTVFMPYVMDPRGGEGMAVFPAPDPLKPEAGPSWDYAQRCGEYSRLLAPYGLRTMYMSRYWFKCRAGAYDGWEWRSGPSGQATMTESFVDYLVWEMNEWIGRDIWDAIYLDEIYEAPTRNVEAGHAIRLPDGSVQAGEMLFGFRELMKRWRNIFHQHNREPMLTVHLTRSFPYCGIVFCDSYLDGEGHPQVTATSRDFVDAVPLARAEVLQNPRLWGVVPFYMVCVWEGGFGAGKDWNPHPRWAWRMARGAVSVLAHFENGETYTDQGNSVYAHYWSDVLRWGAGSTETATFHPYWDNAKYIELLAPAPSGIRNAKGGYDPDVLVSFYRHARDQRILLIASNRTNETAEVRLRLNPEALGWGKADPASLKLQEWDTGYPPAPGEDLLSRTELKQAAQPSMVEPDGLTLDPSDGISLDDNPIQDVLVEEDQENKAAAMVPRIEDGVIVLPIRPKDFRMVSIELPGR